MAESGTSLRGFFEEATREHAQAAVRVGEVDHELCFGDVRVRVRFAGAGLADELLWGLAPRLARTGADWSGVHAHATISLWEARHAPHSGVPPPWSPSDVEPRGLVRVARDGLGAADDDLLAVHDMGSGAITLVDRRTRTLLHRVPDSITLPWWERAAPLRPALFWALSGPMLDLVHAGAVGDEQRGGVLLAGAGGSGKTTVALAALDGGMHYVADDYLLLRSAPAPCAWNVFATAKLDAGHLARFPELARTVRVSAVPLAGEKAVLDVASLPTGRLVPSLTISAVLIPRIRGGRAVLREAGGAEALRALAPSTTLQMPFDKGRVLGSLAALTRTVPAFALDVGDSPRELHEAVDRVLERVATMGVREPARAGAGRTL